jgi:uncharacterized membrane protein YkgB
MKANIIKQDIGVSEGGSVIGRFSSRVLKLEQYATSWMSRYRIVCLQVSLGIIFLVFGALKFFPGYSPAENLAGDTLQMMSFGYVPPMISLPLLAAWECLLGLGLILGHTEISRANHRPSWRNYLLRLTIPALFLHMTGTIMPFFLMPECVFGSQPGGPLLTLECQYIIKNLVIVSAAIAVGGQQVPYIHRKKGN